MIYRVDFGRFITNGEQWGQSIYNYLNQYIDGLTYEADTYKVNFWDLFKIRVSRTGDSTIMYITFPNGSEVTIGGASDIPWADRFEFSLIKSDNFMNFRMRHAEYNGGNFLISWAKDGSVNYAGGDADRDRNRTFYSARLYNVNDTTSPYYPVKLLNFTTASNKLAFSEIAIAATEGNQSFIIPDLCSCSTVTKGDNLTIQGDNYAAIDSNTLVRLDPVT